MTAVGRVLPVALVLATGMLAGCTYDPYTGTYVPCCGYYGYPQYGYPNYRYPPPYYYGPQTSPYYMAPPAGQPSAYPGTPQPAPPPWPGG
ncbi:MAG TPA: hypothetical protein VH855_02705 [Acetobacteraceae bacterium]|jgi:hypothetical protein